MRKNVLVEDFEQAFESTFSYKVDYDGDCWKWIGRTVANPKRGVLLVPGIGRMQAHRFAYEFFIGRIPDGFVVHHECRNTLCVNPQHLRIMKAADHNSHHSSIYHRSRWDFHGIESLVKFLTVKQRQVFNEIRAGKTTNEIALLLNITAKGIEYHRTNIIKIIQLGKPLDENWRKC